MVQLKKTLCTDYINFSLISCTGKGGGNLSTIDKKKGGGDLYGYIKKRGVICTGKGG